MPPCYHYLAMILVVSYNSINNNLSSQYLGKVVLLFVVNGIVMLGYYSRHHRCRHCYSRGGSIVVVLECNDQSYYWRRSLSLDLLDK